MTDLYALSAYHYHLPEELIAQHPCSPRDSSRLMLIDRQSGSISEMPFREISSLLQSGDGLVFNDTKVIPARLLGKRQGGGAAEIFLVKQVSDGLWEVLARPGRKLSPGSKVVFSTDMLCEIVDILPGGGRLAKFRCEGPFDELLEKHGHIPLPQYIKRNDHPQDRECYQTVYAANPGAIAAPTAGLHFTRELLQTLSEKNIEQVNITLHVGLGTFRPVQAADIRMHTMHTESFFIPPKAAEQLNRLHEAKRQICVGTTCCRALESAAKPDGRIIPGGYETDIFIYPGYKFKHIRALLTNFHLPSSSLLMLVCAFAGHELVMEAYAKAVRDKFRFYSYGDAMLIL